MEENSKANMPQLEIKNQLTGRDELAVNLCGTLEGDLAVVHLSVIQRLAKLLPTASFSEIQYNVRSKIEHAGNLEELVAVLEDELKFQKSVNLINSIDAEDVKEMNDIDPDEVDLGM